MGFWVWELVAVTHILISQDSKCFAIASSSLQPINFFSWISSLCSLVICWCLFIISVISISRLVRLFTIICRKWCCEMCNTVFHFKTNYDCHKKICYGIDMYQCDTCGNVYKSKKSLWGHRRKHHIDDVCHFTFFCGECELNQFLTYMMQMWIENFSWFTCYGIVL